MVRNMSFYIGLSLLSNSWHKSKNGQLSLKAESRRILSCLEGRPLTEGEIARDEKGRPFLPESPGDFNISHSGAIAAVSLATGNALHTGIDVQITRPRLSAREIAEAFFTSPERAYIFSSRSAQMEKSRFFEIWALKECFLKLRGLSVFDMASVPSFIDAGGRHFAFGEAVPLPLSFYLYRLEGQPGECYTLAAAIEGNEQPSPEIRWFSQSFLPCRSIAKIKAALSPAKTVKPKM